MLEKVKIYILIFFVYGFAGWLMETVSISIRNKKFVNRGFLTRTNMPNIWLWCNFSKFVIKKISRRYCYNFFHVNYYLWSIGIFYQLFYGKDF